MASGDSLDGETAVVTGASAGIGRETARVLAREGADVVVGARRAERLRALEAAIEEEHSVEALAVPTDVTDPTQARTLVETAADEFGGLDVVVNSAGTGTEPGVDVEDLDTEQYRTVMAVNTDGMFFTTRAALPHLRESSGTAVFVGSFSGRYPRAWSPVYAATKFWTRGFALSLAGQVGDEGVGVTVVNPSQVRTEFGREFRADGTLPKERHDPGEITEPEDVAEAIAFAARQDPPNAVTELDLFRRDRLSEF